MTTSHCAKATCTTKMSGSTAALSLIPLKFPSTFRAKLGFPAGFLKEKNFRRNRLRNSPISCSQNQQEQQLSLSVLRFTLGIPGLDESYLPRYIGYAFGSLLVLNHFVGSDLSTITPAQLRTEVLGLCLAAFSVFVPYMGRFLKGATPFDQKSVPEDAEQIFVLSQNMSDALKEDLAWASFVLLRNTGSISALISVCDALCARGYWNIPADLAKSDLVDLFGTQSQQIGLSNLKETLYFPVAEDSELLRMLPVGTRSFLVQPILGAPDTCSRGTEKSMGFVLLASSIDYAYSYKDRAWIAAVANKFRGINVPHSQM